MEGGKGRWVGGKRECIEVRRMSIPQMIWFDRTVTTFLPHIYTTAHLSNIQYMYTHSTHTHTHARTHTHTHKTKMLWRNDIYIILYIATLRSLTL